MFPFKKGWFTAGHSELWNCDSTYCFVPYEKLPKLDLNMFQGDFQWLVNSEDDLECALYVEEQDNLTVNLNRIITAAEQKKLKLPDSFLTFLKSPHLQNRVPSCTACFLDLSDRLIESSLENDGYLIRFLNDSQNVLHWYLYLNKTSEHCIVVAKPEFSEDLDGETLEDVSTPTEIFYCAPSFEEFIYRFWIENSIWFALNDEIPLTKEQKEYMDTRRE